MEKNLVIVCDSILSEFGPLRPAILMAKEFIREGFNVKILSTTITENMRSYLESLSISTVSLGKKIFFKKDESLAWLQLWFCEALLSRNSRKVHNLNGVVLNFSNQIAVPSEIWYGQGPPTVTLDKLKEHMAWCYKIPYIFGAPFLRYKDKTLNKKFAQLAKKLIVNSQYLSTVYSKFGFKVHGVIYPPLDCEKFKPTISQPSGDYVLTYFGKETQFPVIKEIAEKGVPIKAFGSKLTAIPKFVQKHPFIEPLGRVSLSKLVNLYSNALFTIYPFSDEPFGYIPVESMACGTPVLTFNCQGPSESVLQNITGWLVENNKQMVNFATELWKKGYLSSMRKACRKRALAFDTKNISKKWFDLIIYP